MIGALCNSVAPRTVHRTHTTTLRPFTCGDKELLPNVQLVSEVWRSCEVKQTESDNSPVISNK